MDYDNFYDTKYYFHLPEAGDIKTHTVNGKERLDCILSTSGNALIEAAYSFILHELTGVCRKRSKKEIEKMVCNIC